MSHVVKTIAWQWKLDENVSSTGPPPSPLFSACPRNLLWNASDIDKLEMPRKDFNLLSVASIFPRFFIHLRHVSIRFELLFVDYYSVFVYCGFVPQSRRQKIQHERNAQKEMCDENNEKSVRAEQTKRTNKFLRNENFLSSCDKFTYYLYATQLKSQIRAICSKM